MGFPLQSFPPPVQPLAVSDDRPLVALGQHSVFSRPSRGPAIEANFDTKRVRLGQIVKTCRTTPPSGV
jgi:hypothetical protein